MRPEGSAEGVLKILIFLIVLMLGAWGVNIYKHYKNGWTKPQKIMDICGIIIIFTLLILVMIPELR